MTHVPTPYMYGILLESITYHNATIIHCRMTPDQIYRNSLFIYEYRTIHHTGILLPSTNIRYYPILDIILIHRFFFYIIGNSLLQQNIDRSYGEFISCYYEMQDREWVRLKRTWRAMFRRVYLFPNVSITYMESTRYSQVQLRATASPGAVLVHV